MTYTMCDTEKLKGQKFTVGKALAASHPLRKGVGGQLPTPGWKYKGHRESHFGTESAAVEPWENAACARECKCIGHRLAGVDLLRWLRLTPQAMGPTRVQQPAQCNHKFALLV